MEKTIKRKIIFVTAICSTAVAAGLFGYFLAPKTAPPSGAVPEAIGAAYKRYENTRLGFLVEYPSIYTNVDERENAVVFDLGDGNPDGFAVVVSPAQERSTEEWLDHQAKGSATAAGYREVFWIDGRGSGWTGGRAVVTKYVIVDYDGDRPIYGQIVMLVAVKDGKRYEVVYKNQHPADSAPQIPDEYQRIFSSFIVL